MKNFLPLRGIQLFIKQAERLARDPEAATRIVEDAMRKAKEHSGAFHKVQGEVTTLFRMLTAALRGQYRAVPWSSVLMALAAIIYFVNPLDIVPDFIIGAGLVDDLTVIAFVLNSLKTDLEIFRRWETGTKT